MGYKKERFKIFVRLSLHHFIGNSITEKQFEKYIEKNRSKFDNDEDAAKIIKHFKKEVFPLGKDTILWMLQNFHRDEINFYSKFKEMKKLKTNI